MNANGVVTAARVTHETGSVDDIATAAPDSQMRGVETLCSYPQVSEAYVLSTCNRVEAYVVAPDVAVGQAALERFFDAVDDDALVVTEHDESLRHLLCVATGLESVVLGEDQIIGQIRDAYEDARSADGIGDLLETVVTKAIHVGERARTETAINEGIVSLGSAATHLVAGDCCLEGACALVVGAGEMGKLSARSLADAGVDDLIIANRTVSHAAQLADQLEVEAECVPLEALSTVTATADVVVAATNSDEPVVKPHHLTNECVDTDRVVVDLGQPRDVTPAADTVEGVTVYDLDDLERVTAETRDKRADAARKVEAIIDHEFDLLCDQLKRARADEVIAAMYESADRIKARELETAISRGEFSDEQREIIESMADALVGQLLAPPTKSLREAAGEDDWSTISTALQLFDPELDDGPQSAVSSSRRAEQLLAVTDDD